MKTIVRIKRFLDSQGISYNAFDTSIGAGNGYIGKQIKKEGSVGSDVLEKILSTYQNLSPRWLITGDGSMLLENDNSIAIVREPAETYNVVHREVDVVHRKEIPLIPINAMAGIIGDKATIREQDIKERYVIPDFQDVDFMVRVKGSSMYPKYNSGDIVACRLLRESAFIQWGKVYVLDTIEQGALVKRIRKGPSPDVLLAISDNESYEPFEIPRSEVRALALVVGVVRLE